MTSAQQQKIKSKILEDINATSLEIVELEKLITPIAPDCSLERLTREEMIIEQGVSEQTLQEAKIRFNKLTYALQKVDTKEYGICAECEEEIMFERLMLLPESTHCVECKQELGL